LTELKNSTTFGQNRLKLDMGIIASKEEYANLFNLAMAEVFESKSSNTLIAMRSEYEEAKLLFKSTGNRCRDVVAIGRTGTDETTVLVHVVQLREGLVAGRFSYWCQLKSGLSTEEDVSAVIQAVLERQHYPSGGESGVGQFYFFPEEILLSCALENAFSRRNNRTMLSKGGGQGL
jgi:hypothetical protein